MQWNIADGNDFVQYAQIAASNGKDLILVDAYDSTGMVNDMGQMPILIAPGKGDYQCNCHSFTVPELQEIAEGRGESSQILGGPNWIGVA